MTGKRADAVMPPSDGDTAIFSEMRAALVRVAASHPSEADQKRALALCLGVCADQYGQRFGYEAVKTLLVHAQRVADEKTIRGQLIYALDERMRDE